MKKSKYATTFGGSEISSNSILYDEGIRIGELLAEKKYIVKCGGYYGLMEAVSKGVHNLGGTCIGVTNASFDPKPPNSFISEERKTKDLFDRLRELTSQSELFIFQQGGIGTLDELCIIWCLRYTCTIENIRICLIGSFWNKVIKGFEHLSIKSKDFELLEIFDNFDQFIKIF